MPPGQNGEHRMTRHSRWRELQYSHGGFYGKNLVFRVSTGVSHGAQDA